MQIGASSEFRLTGMKSNSSNISNSHMWVRRGRISVGDKTRRQKQAERRHHISIIISSTQFITLIEEKIAIIQPLVMITFHIAHTLLLACSLRTINLCFYGIEGVWVGGEAGRNAEKWRVLATASDIKIVAFKSGHGIRDLLHVDFRLLWEK